jgi:hypothetical protein
VLASRPEEVKQITNSTSWRLSEWLDKQSVSGVKNSYLVGGGGLLMVLALAGAKRRR